MLSILSLADSWRVRAVSLELARRARRALISVRDPRQARELLRAGGIALALLDAELAGVDASYVSALRQAGFRAPLVCVAEARRERELSAAGASDVVSRDLPKRARVAQIAAWLEAETHPDLSFGPLELEPAARRVRIAGTTPVRLTAAEHALLVLLIARRGEIVTRSEISSAVLGWWGASDNAYFHVHNLKRKLGRAGALIRNVRGEGYRLAQSVVWNSSEPSSVASAV